MESEKHLILILSRLTVRAINYRTKLWTWNYLNKEIGTCAIINSNIVKCNVITICHLLLKQAPEIECKVASSLYSFGPFVGAPKNVSSFLLSTWSLLYVFWINARTHTQTHTPKCTLALMYAHQCTHLSTHPHPYTKTLVHTCTHPHTFTTLWHVDIFGSRFVFQSSWAMKRVSDPEIEASLNKIIQMNEQKEHLNRVMSYNFSWNKCSSHWSHW